MLRRNDGANSGPIDYRTIPDISFSNLASRLISAGPEGSGAIEVQIPLLIQPDIRRVWPLDMSMTVYVVNRLGPGDVNVTEPRLLPAYGRLPGSEYS